MITTRQRKFLVAGTICLKTSFAYADPFSDLQTSINNHETVINLPSTPINWSTSDTLFLTYNLTLNNQTGVPFTFTGTGTNGSLFVFGTNGSTAFNPIVTWNGDFIFDNVVVNNPAIVIGTALSLSPPHATSGNSTAIFNGNIIFTNNAVSGGYYAGVGGALSSYQSILTFNQQAKFENNTVAGTNTAAGGALINAFSNAVLTFNQSSGFINNSVTSQNGPALGGAIASAGSGVAGGYLGRSTTNFNAQTIFSGNSVTNNSPTNAGNISNAYGGGIAAVIQTDVILTNPQFINNQASAPNANAKGGGIFLDNATVTIRATDPSTPVLFQGNTVKDSLGERREALYLSAEDLRSLLNLGNASVGPATLTLNTDANTKIDIQDGISSDGGGNQIIKQGLGIWQQGGNSSAYRDTTMITAGIWRLQAGAIYGNSSAGTATILSSASLIFNVIPDSFPLLQAYELNLNGSISVDGVASFIPNLALGTSTSTPLIKTGTPIKISNIPVSAGDILLQENNLFYDVQLGFSSPTQLDFIVGRNQNTLTKVVQASGSSPNLLGVANAMDAVDSRQADALSAYKAALEISASSEQAISLLQPLQGITLTGGSSAVQNSINAFVMQLDQRLSATQIKDKTGTLLASLSNQLPLSYSSRQPWGAWAQVMGGWGQREQHHGDSGYRSGSSGLSIGLDHGFDNWHLGLAINTQHSVLDWQQYNAKTKADTVAFAFYGAYDTDIGYTRWQLGAGRTLVDHHRNIPSVSPSTPNLTASSNPTLHAYNANASVGRYICFNNFCLTPSASLAYLRSVNSAYNESGAGQFNLHVDHAVQNNLETQINFAIKHTAISSHRPITTRVNLGVGYEMWDKQANLLTAFATFPDLPTWNTSSSDTGRWRATFGLGIDACMTKNARFSLDYLGSIKRHEYNHTGVVSFKKAF